MPCFMTSMWGQVFNREHAQQRAAYTNLDFHINNSPNNLS